MEPYTQAIEDGLDTGGIPVRAEMLPAAMDIEALITRAIDKGISVETMERLLAMRRELKAEWARERYYVALSAFQSECPEIPKSKEVYDKAEKGGGLRYRYAPMPDIIRTVQPILQRHGFSYDLDAEQTDTHYTAILNIHHGDGHTEVKRFRVPIDLKAYMNDPQKVGSGSTYSMRYVFRNGFGIMTADEDDDGAAAGEPDPLPACPKCGETKTVIRGREEYGGGFVCWKKRGGCGAQWADTNGKGGVDKQEKSPGLSAVIPEHGGSNPPAATPKPAPSVVPTPTPAAVKLAPPTGPPPPGYPKPTRTDVAMVDYTKRFVDAALAAGFTARILEDVAARDVNGIYVYCPECQLPCYTAKSEKAVTEFACMGSPSQTGESTYCAEKDEHGNVSKDQAGKPWRAGWKRPRGGGPGSWYTRGWPYTKG